MEVTIVAGPSDLDADQVVRLVMGLRLRYAHYPDWTALPAPLFFIIKVDDYVIRYADIARADDAEEASAYNTAEEISEADPGAGADADADAAIIDDTIAADERA